MSIPTSAQQVKNDILNARVYTLSNGLKVYMSVNKAEPKIQTYIAVKAGSKFDPSETTGLAHYLEHLMFKGTPNLGTTNWPEEKILLDKIATLYEEHKNEKDPTKKKALYAMIDKVSLEASQYAVPNEYDKAITSLGAQGTNAYTSNDQTVYQNSIPSNELEKWLALESERFQHLVMRLFHTELEAVYEEFNISQDNDGRWAYANLLKALYPTHPYGTQTTIGEGEHLKNPSHYNIRNYFNTYYVPNNVAICLAGDIDPDKTIKLIEQYFGKWQRKDINPFVMPELPAIDKPLKIENFGPQEEFVYVGYRIPAMNNKESYKAMILDQIMANGTAGLIDLNVVQKQKVLSAYSFNILLHDAGVFALYGKPKAGQSLDEVKDILIEQVDKVKKGQFDDWLISAGINDIELKMIKGYETNQARAGAFVTAFTNDIEWSDYASRIADMRSITKKDIIDFANQYLNQNYAVSYKRKGKEDKPKVEQPKITPVQLNRDRSSGFYNHLKEMPSASTKPVFVDYQSAIKENTLPNGVKLYTLRNDENNYAKFSLIYPFGKDQVKEVSLAMTYMDFLGTRYLSNEQLKKELFKSGLEISQSVERDRIIVTLSGLEQSMPNGLNLLFDQLSGCKVDMDAWKNLLGNIRKERENAKINKGAIFGALSSFAKYGAKNPMNTTYTDAELLTVDPNKMIEFIHKLYGTSHSALYYGQKTDMIDKWLPAAYQSSKLSKGPSAKMVYPIQPTTENKVLFYNYPGMVQAQIMLTRRADNYQKSLLPFMGMYNDFFGSGLSSIVFQELREQKALAYSAYSRYMAPSIEGEPFYFQSFIGTQADKMGMAAKEFKKLLNTNPSVEIQYNNSRESVMKQIASDRIIRDNVFWSYLNAKKMGYNSDYRREIYDVVKSSNLNGFVSEFQKRISNQKYTTIIMGDKTKLNMKDLEEFGQVIELDAKGIFGY